MEGINPVSVVTAFPERRVRWGTSKWAESCEGETCARTCEGESDTKPSLEPI